MRVRHLARTSGIAYWLSWLPILIVVVVVGALLAGLIAGARALRKEFTMTAPAALTFTRTPELDLRVDRGDRFDADAWQCSVGHRLWTAVGHQPLACTRCDDPAAASCPMGAWADLLRE